MRSGISDAQRRDVERRLESGELAAKARGAGTGAAILPKKTTPAKVTQVRQEAPAPSPAEDAIKAAHLAAQEAEYADKKPRPGSAASGIVCRAKQQKIPGVPNKTEAAYGAILETMKKAGDILDYRYESIRLKTGVGAWYTPDYYVVYPDGRVYLVEVKAFRDDKETGEMIRIVNEDSAEKIKSCLLLHPYPIRFAFGRYLGKAGGHEFREEWAQGIEP